MKKIMIVKSDDREFKPGDLVQHFKGGMYQIITPLAYNSETLEALVVYRSLANEEVYVRPLNMFISKVDKEKYPEADGYRFTKVEFREVNKGER